MDSLDINLFIKEVEEKIEILEFRKKHIEYINYYYIYEKRNIKRLRILNEELIFEQRKVMENNLSWKEGEEHGFPYFALSLLYKDFITEYKRAADQLNCFDFYIARSNYLKAISLDNKYKKKSIDEFFACDNFLNENKFQNQISIKELGYYFCEEFLKLGNEHSTKKNYNVAAEYFSRLGHTQFELKNYSECIEFLTKSLKINPFEIYSYYVRGMSKMSLQDYTGAISDFNFIIKSEPSNGECYCLRGECYLKLKKKKNALIDLSRAGELGFKRSYELISKL